MLPERKKIVKAVNRIKTIQKICLILFNNILIKLKKESYKMPIQNKLKINWKYFSKKILSL